MVCCTGIMQKSRGGFRHVVARGRNALWEALMHKQENIFFLLTFHKMWGPLGCSTLSPPLNPAPQKKRILELKPFKNIET